MENIEETKPQTSPTQTPVPERPKLTAERPRIFDIPGGFELRWSFTDLDISAYVNHITDRGMAEVEFRYANLEQIENHRETLLLAPNRVDFLSSTQKYNLAKQLHDIGHTDEFLAFADWERKVNDIALAVMQNCRKDIPAVEVAANEAAPLAAEYIVKPILYKDVPNVIFGDFGSYKSLLAMILAFVAQLPYHDNELGLVVGKESIHCLWLDYEGQERSFRQRWAAIQRGFDLGLDIRYKEMTAPLADAIESLQYEMAENRIELLVVDSLGPAAGGNLNDPEPAIAYHQALRTLGGTSLTLAHNSKDLVGNKSIFGSVFFSNLARSIWQCKAEKEPLDSRGTISLKQVKASLSQLHGTLGFVFDFDEQTNRITVTKSDLRDTSLAGELPLSVQIRGLLRNGAMSVKDITESLGANEPSIRTAIHRLGKNNQLVQMGDLWGLSEA